jgi:hypothetical protein
LQAAECRALTGYPGCPVPLQAALGELEALRRERAAHEEALRAAAAEARRREMAELRREAAAYAIQNAWKVMKKRRAAEAKAKGGKGGSAKKSGSATKKK